YGTWVAVLMPTQRTNLEAMSTETMPAEIDARTSAEKPAKARAIIRLGFAGMAIVALALWFAWNRGMLSAIMLPGNARPTVAILLFVGTYAVIAIGKLPRFQTRPSRGGAPRRNLDGRMRRHLYRRSLRGNRLRHDYAPPRNDDRRRQSADLRVLQAGEQLGRNQSAPSFGDARCPCGDDGRAFSLSCQ